MCNTLWMPEIFASGMVVQRDGFPLWGKAAAGKPVTVRWNGIEYQTVAKDDGLWELPVAGAAAGGPYTLRVSSENTVLEFSDVWSGEVWLVSGQSNMELKLRETDDSPSVAKLADRVHIRYFSQCAWMASMPQQSVADGHWSHITRNNAYDMSAIGFYVAAELSRSLAVPVGIVYAAFGGRDIECFLNAQSLASCGRTVFREGQPPSGVYNAMLYPIRRYGIRGILWYQGENNSDAYPERYGGMLSAFIRQCRKDWQKMLPFLFVQLPRYDLPGTRFHWCVIREQQARVWNEVSNTGMVVTIDTGEQDYIHPSEKRVVSSRLAELAKGMVYHMPALWQYPQYKAAHLRANTMILTVDGPCLRPASYAKGVELCGQDGVFYPALSMVTSHCISSCAPQVPHPVAARYAWDNYPEADIMSEEGLPLAPYRVPLQDWKGSVVYSVFYCYF